MSARSYPADSYGGQWVYGGGAPSSALAPPGAHLTQAIWDDTPILDMRHCQATNFKTGNQCRAWPMKGTPYCTFHTREVDSEDS